MEEDNQNTDRRRGRSNIEEAQRSAVAVDDVSLIEQQIGSKEYHCDYE
jgi:hypothetical protein